MSEVSTAHQQDIKTGVGELIRTFPQFPILHYKTTTYIITYDTYVPDILDITVIYLTNQDHQHFLNSSIPGLVCHWWTSSHWWTSDHLYNNHIASYYLYLVAAGLGQLRYRTKFTIHPSHTRIWRSLLPPPLKGLAQLDAFINWPSLLAKRNRIKTISFSCKHAKECAWT